MATETMKKEFLPVVDLSGMELQVPLVTINGAHKGLTLGLVAGVHACEYVGPETVMKLCSAIDPSKLRGRILAVPMANIPGFLARQAFVNPIDQLDIDNLYDGEDPNPHSQKRARVFGTISASLTYPYGIKNSVSQTLANKLWDSVVSKTDYLIDYHGGDLPEEIIDHVQVAVTGNQEIDSKSQSLAECFETSFVWKEPASAKGGGLVGAANRKQIPGVRPKVGHSGKAQDSDINLAFNGTMNVMKHLKMMDGEPKLTQQRTIKAKHHVKTNHAGIYRPLKTVGATVSKKEMVGEIRNLFGKTVEEIQSPVDGILFCHTFNPSVLPGDSIWIVGEL
jgi:predicted deacylase